MPTFAEAHAQRVAEFRAAMAEELRINLDSPHGPTGRSQAEIDAAVERLHRLWTAKPVAGPFVERDGQKIPYDGHTFSGRFDRN